MISLGVAVPHYDGLFPAGVDGTTTGLALRYVRRIEDAGLSQIWVSDHLWVDVAAGDRRRSPDCWSLLAAAAATTEHVRIGSLVTPAALRRPAQLLQQITTVRDLAGDRLDVGLGAGWQAQEFAACGLTFPTTAERINSVTSMADLIRGTWPDAAPRICVGGKRVRIRRIAGRVADTWNLAWDPQPDDFAELLAEVRTVAAGAGRPSGSPSASVGLTTVIGRSEDDLRTQWTRLRQWVPGGHLDDVPYDVWRRNGLVGTVTEVTERMRRWEELGADHVVCALGMPFGLFDEVQLDLLVDVADRLMS